MDSSYESLSAVAWSWCHETLSTSDTRVSQHILTMNREREDIWFGIDIESEK